MINYPGMLSGFAIYESQWCTVSEEMEVNRTWKERLFSLPWKPMKKTKIITVDVPSPDLYMTENAIFGHPETIRKLREELKC